MHTLERAVSSYVMSGQGLSPMRRAEVDGTVMIQKQLAFACYECGQQQIQHTPKAPTGYCDAFPKATNPAQIATNGHHKSAQYCMTSLALKADLFIGGGGGGGFLALDGGGGGACFLPIPASCPFVLELVVR